LVWVHLKMTGTDPFQTNRAKPKANFFKVPGESQIGPLDRFGPPNLSWSAKAKGPRA
jgi:hypothetical protein